MPALFGTGYRWYVCLGYSPGQFIRVGAKFSESTRYGVTTMGSGYDETDGNARYDVRFQADLTL